MNTIQNKFDLSEDRKLSFIKKNVALLWCYFLLRGIGDR